MKQLGVIVFGGGLNKDVEIAEAKSRGFEVRVFDTHAELWGDYKVIFKKD